MSGLKRKIYFTNNWVISMSYGSFSVVRAAQTHSFCSVALAPVASTFFKRRLHLTKPCPPVAEIFNACMAERDMLVLVGVRLG